MQAIAPPKGFNEPVQYREGRAVARTSLRLAVSRQSSTMPQKPPTAPRTSPREMGTRITSAATVMMRGVVVTKSRPCGMLVWSRPQTQVPKCAARHAPEPARSHHSWRHLARVSGVQRRHWKTKSGARRSEVAWRRHAATVRGFGAGSAASSSLKADAADETARICTRGALSHAGVSAGAQRCAGGASGRYDGVGAWCEGGSERTDATRST